MRKLTYFILTLVALTLATPAFAQDTTGGGGMGAANWVAITSGFAMAIAVAFATLAQAKVASSVAEALARNPSARPGIQLALFLGLAFIESLVLFTLLVVFVQVK